MASLASLAGAAAEQADVEDRLGGMTVDAPSGGEEKKIIFCDDEPTNLDMGAAATENMQDRQRRAHMNQASEVASRPQAIGPIPPAAGADLAALRAWAQLHIQSFLVPRTQNKRAHVKWANEGGAERGRMGVGTRPRTGTDLTGIGDRFDLKSGLKGEQLETVEREINADKAAAIVLDWDRTTTLLEGLLLQPATAPDLDSTLEMYKAQGFVPATATSQEIAKFWLEDPSPGGEGRREKLGQVLRLANEKNIPIFIITNNEANVAFSQGISDILQQGLGVDVEVANIMGGGSKGGWLPKIQTIKRLADDARINLAPAGVATVAVPGEEGGGTPEWVFDGGRRRTRRRKTRISKSRKKKKGRRRKTHKGRRRRRTFRRRK